MQQLIAANDFCIHYNIEYSFINSLSDFGLIQLTTVEESGFIHHDELPKLERLIRLHRDLNINTEGLEAVNNLLQTIENMHNEITSLKNKLRMFEPVM